MTSCPHCGSDLTPGSRKTPRSTPQLRRYFALTRSAWQHWPEGHARQFSSPEELRKWAQMAVGHREVACRMPIVGMRPESAILLAEASIRAAGAHAVAVEHRGELVIWKPRSISYRALGHIEFCRLNDAVADLIAQETGMTEANLLDARIAA